MKKESGENNMPVYEVDGKKPIIDGTVYIADGGHGHRCGNVS